MRRYCLYFWLSFWTLTVGLAEAASMAPARYYSQGCLIVRLVGSPEELGQQHGRFLRQQVRRVVEAVIRGEAPDAQRYARLIAGARRMEHYLPPDIRRELHALAAEADVNYEELVALQLFGDVWRATRCSSFAVFGPATETGELIAGRNFDFWDHGVSRYAAVILHYIPDEGWPFFTVTWAGIINGWTAMNLKGVIAANNTSGGRDESLEGLSTCFMLRKIVQHASTVQEGVRIIEETPRACGTNMLVAGGNPPMAAVVEYDHAHVAVRWAKLVQTHFQAPAESPEQASKPAAPHFEKQQAETKEENLTPKALFEIAPPSSLSEAPLSSDDKADFFFPGLQHSAWEYEHKYSYVSDLPGVVIATNHFRKLFQAEGNNSRHIWCSRYRRLEQLIGENYGKINRQMNLIAAPGVPLGSSNLHSALLFPAHLMFKISMGHVPAYEYPFRTFRLTATEIVPAEDN